MVWRDVMWCETHSLTLMQSKDSFCSTLSLTEEWPYHQLWITEDCSCFHSYNHLLPQSNAYVTQKKASDYKMSKPGLNDLLGYETTSHTLECCHEFTHAVKLPLKELVAKSQKSSKSLFTASTCGCRRLGTWFCFSQQNMTPFCLQQLSSRRFTVHLRTLFLTFALILL